MARDEAAEAFWRFSLMIYARPGVSGALLGLQDRAGHNVNLVLFGLWLATCRGHRLDAKALAHARAAMAGLAREIVQPVRDLRRALKGDRDRDIQDMRRRLLEFELAAERRVQARLAASIVVRRTAATTDPARLVEANLRLILGPDFSSPEVAMIRQAIGSARSSLGR